MRRWLRRLLYLLFVVVWLVVISFPILAFILATRGEMRIGDGRNHLRLFLIQEQETEGIGVEWARPLRQQASCSKTTVTYFTWAGKGENVAFCQCYDPLTNTPLPPAQPSCNSP